MDARSIIAKLRNKDRLDKSELVWFSNGLASGDVTDAQAGAFAMATCLNGLSIDERVALTLAMRDSGDVMNWDVPGPIIDKHSTGGIGDCVSLVLAPALAALGAYVPMISGRGLGHTGGTLDKLESILGLNTEVSEDRFKEIVGDIGLAIVSATGTVAPADKRLYAVRDVTATVESVDLITASILSKKLAAGLDALVLDVKVGSGAFMKTLKDAQALAEALVATANGAGCKTAALITDMNQPATSSIGNALEIRDVMAVLSGDKGVSNLYALVRALGGELLALAGLAADKNVGAEKIAVTLADGSAMERFEKMVVALGGPNDFARTWQDVLPSAPVIRDVFAPQSGFVGGIDGEALGYAVVHLGGGRLKGTDSVDPAVGLSNTAMLGDLVSADHPIAQVHANSETDAEMAVLAVQEAYDITNSAPEKLPVIYRSIC